MRSTLCYALLALCLLATPVLAQQGGVGTGEDGCYFGQCDSPEQPPRENRETDRPSDREDAPRKTERYPSPPGPKVCVTHFGFCQMSAPAGDGAICNCPGLAQGYQAVGIVKQQGDISLASVPNISSICVTQFGVCQMGVQLPRGQNCFCPTYTGPLWGVAQ